MGTPRYQSIKHDELNKYDLGADAGTVEIIAGGYEGITGNAETFTDMHVYNTRLNAGGAAVFNFPPAFNTGFLVIEGSIVVNESTTAQEGAFVYFANDGTEIQIKASERSVVLILSGEPIDEPVAHYGPFLMNTSEEIEQAIDDYNRGCFGYLEED